MKDFFKKAIKKIDNFFYHYKWHVVITCFFVGVLVFIVANSDKGGVYDVNVLYTGPHIFTAEEKAEIESAFEQIMSRDFDGNGKKSVLLADMSAFTDEQAKQAISDSDSDGTKLIIVNYGVDRVEENFTNEVFAGESTICLLDRYWYDRVRESGGFVELAEVLGYKPESAIDDYGIYLKDTEFGRYFSAFEGLPDDTILCMRRLSTVSIFTGKKKAERKYEYAKQTLCDIFEFGS